MTLFSKTHSPLLLISTLCLLIGSYFLFSDGLPLETTRSTRAFWNLGHVLYFSILTIILLQLPYFKKLPYLKLCFGVLIGAIVIGVGIEALQYGTARNTDVWDVAHDILGSLIVLAFYRPISPKIKTQSTAIFKAITLLLALISLWPVSIALWDEAHAESQFPILSDFSSALEMTRWIGNTEFSYAQTIDKKEGAMRITFNTKRYPSVHLKYFESDWSGYKKIILTLYNPNPETIPIVFRVHDVMHKPDYLFADRLSLHLRIKHGWNTIEFPLSEIEKAPRTRLMNLKRIDGLGLYTIRLQQPKELYLKSISLSH